jgi:hypothetical protein
MRHHATYTEEKLEIKARVKRAFQQLRTADGFIARGNYLCCSSCAGYAIGTDARKSGHKFCAFWHKQDEEHFRDGKEPSLAIRYGAINNDDEKETLYAGRVVERVLKANGLTLEWDGNPSTVIFVTGLAPVPETKVPERAPNTVWELKRDQFSRQHQTVERGYGITLSHDLETAVVLKFRTGKKPEAAYTVTFKGQYPSCTCKGGQAVGYCKHSIYAEMKRER